MPEPVSLKMLNLSDKQQQNASQKYFQLIRPGDSPFPVPQLPLKHANHINLVFFILNGYVFFIKTKHCYMVSILVYIYGMLLLGNKSTAIKRFIKTRNLNPIYFVNIFIWFCEFKGTQIQQKYQIYTIAIIIVVYFGKFLMMFIFYSYISIFMKRPTFRQTYIISQMITLRNIIPKTLINLTGLNVFQIFRQSSICVSIVQNWKLGQQRHLITVFRLVCQLYSLFLPKFGFFWIVLRIIITVLTLGNDLLYVWDPKRLSQGSKAFSDWVYVTTWTINMIGRCYWIYEVRVGQVLYCGEAIVMYHKIFWNLVRVDKNYSKNILKKVKQRRMTLKFITGKDNTISIVQSILHQNSSKIVQKTLQIIKES